MGRWTMTDIKGYGDERLPYGTRLLEVPSGEVEEYIIPEEDRAKVFRILYPFLPIPSMDQEMLDIHEDKLFIVREFKVVRDGGMNILVSPFFARSGGTVIDWWPPDSEVEYDEELPFEDEQDF